MHNYVDVQATSASDFRCFSVIAVSSFQYHFFVRHLSAGQREDLKCAGFHAWLFNAGFNLILLILFVQFHKSRYTSQNPYKLYKSQQNLKQ